MFIKRGGENRRWQSGTEDHAGEVCVTRKAPQWSWGAPVPLARPHRGRGRGQRQRRRPWFMDISVMFCCLFVCFFSRLSCYQKVLTGWQGRISHQYTLIVFCKQNACCLVTFHLSLTFPKSYCYQIRFTLSSRDYCNLLNREVHISGWRKVERAS